MSVFTDLVGYDLEVEWLLTWYPITATGALRNVQIRGGTFVHSLKEFPEINGYYKGTAHSLHQGDRLGAVSQNIDAQIQIDVDQRQIFIAMLQLTFGRHQRIKRNLLLLPDTTIPYMINIQAHADEDDPGIQNTAMVLQGVFRTTPRALGALTQFISH